jgi:ketosteroid isomerase-like protein
MATATDTAARAEFAAFFADGWAIGATDPDGFFDHFASRMTDDAVFTQPLAPTRRGPAGLRRLLDPLFAAFPDLRGELIRWGPTEDGVIAELRLSSASTGVGWTTLDVIQLRDGRIARRDAHFDPLPLLGALLKRPRVAARLLPPMLSRR